MKPDRVIPMRFFPFVDSKPTRKAYLFNIQCKKWLNPSCDPVPLKYRLQRWCLYIKYGTILTYWN